MSLVDMMMRQNSGGGEESTKGVAVAVVTNNQDPEKLGKIKVKYPWRNTEDESYWARIMTFMAGNDMGGYFLPEVGDEVLVAFENGDIDHPIILGLLWSGKMKPPETNSDGKNNRRLIKSRSGHLIILDDKNGSEKIEVIDKSGKNLLRIDTATNTIEITSNQDIKLKAPNGKISLDCLQLEMKASTSAKLEANASLDLKATGNTTLKGAMVMIN
jgi:uncharacterized protein involved in type VI secretion and phage assembly